MTSPCHTARTQNAAVINHNTTNMTVNPLATPSIALLLSALPAWIVASVSPALGKMNAHQFSEKDIFLVMSPEIIVTVVMKKNQYAKSTMNNPAMMPMIFTISPSGTVVSVK